MNTDRPTTYHNIHPWNAICLDVIPYVSIQQRVKVYLVKELLTNSSFIFSS